MAAFTPGGNTVAPLGDGIYDVAVTPDGGYVIAGVVGAKMNEVLLPAETGSVFVAKIHPDGTLQWQKEFQSSTGAAFAYGVAVSPAGRVTVVGEFGGEINFGGSVLLAQSYDIFIVTLDAMGAHVWSKRFGTTSRQSALDVDADAAGNLYVTGLVTGVNVSLGGAPVTPDGQDLFVASYDSAGNHLWSSVFVNGGTQVGRHLTVTRDGNVAVVGDAAGDAVGDANFGGSNLPNGGDTDLVVAMYASNGAHIWSERFGEFGSSQFTGHIAAAPNGGNILIAGRFTGKVDFGGGQMSAAGLWDTFVAELAAANGEPVRSKRFGLSGTSLGTGIAVDGAGNVTVTGLFNGSVDFGSGTITTGDGYDIFVAKLAAADWSPLWTKTFGVNGTQAAWAITADAKGDVIVGGSFDSQIAFGAPLATIPSSGGADLFSVRLAP
ncbi:hypothetical protein [Polyangium jinanense]|uniref:Beta-propeller repeat-containing protein n=1 Tax=Polyangium jinanense TaxID=2829994 RepID=A0A9X4AXS9_9BACT|nr:hypothetical protein [Polyangium jinanense]MDC3962058.1 hypothetical protein [Polyangium jinanense]MDC3988774.1 hypothetical protein [Polyangium jinanense]